MKTSLKSVLVLITEQPIDDMPFMKKIPTAVTACRWAPTCRRPGRYRRPVASNASTSAISPIASWEANRPFCPRGNQGFAPALGDLRYYPLRRERTERRKVVYLATPMINKPEIFDLAEGKSVVEACPKEGYESIS